MFRPLPLLSLPLLLCALAAQNQQATVDSAKDNTLYDDTAGSLSNGAGPRMFCGNTGFMTGGKTRRALVAFDVASRIPRRSTIVSVTLNLNMIQGTSTTQSVTVHRVTANWGEGTSVAGSGGGGGAPSTPGDATWIHTFFSNQRWAAAGGDFAATPSATTQVMGAGPYTWASTAAMVAEVQGWLDNPATNFGWMLRTTEVGTNTAVAFETREGATPTTRPQLVVVYTPPAAAVASTGTGCNGGGTSPLTISASGLPQVPNPAFAINLTGGPATGLRAMVFALDLFGVPIPLGNGCFLYLNPGTIAVTLSAPAPSFPLPVPNDTSFLGVDLPIQAISIDPTPLLGSSNALTLRFGI